MYATFELNDDSIIGIDSNIQSLSWISKTSKEGWIATGNTNAVVGCTFTTCLTEEQYDPIKKRKENSSKNFEGRHKSEIKLVSWNEVSLENFLNFKPQINFDSFK